MQPSLVLLARAVVHSILKSQEELMHGSALKKVNSKHLWSRGHDASSVIQLRTLLSLFPFFSAPKGRNWSQWVGRRWTRKGENSTISSPERKAVQLLEKQVQYLHGVHATPPHNMGLGRVTILSWRGLRKWQKQEGYSDLPLPPPSPYLKHILPIPRRKENPYERLLLTHEKTPGFLASRGEEFNPGPEMRLDRAEPCVIKFY